MSQPKYDLFSPHFKANPFPTLATMRHNHPVYCHVAPYGARIWYITRYEDVLTVLKDNKRFTKTPPGEQHPGNLFQMINRNMLFADPPDHTRLRALVSQAFTPRRVENLAPQIRAIAQELLDRVQAQGQMDVMADFAFPLPVTVIMALLGIPAGDRAQVHEWTKAIIAPGRYGITLKTRKRNIRAFVEYLQKMFALRQKEPQDDLISALVQAEEAGDKLTEAELSSMVALLFVTGHETVVNLIGNGLHALLQQPEQLQLLRTRPELLPQAIEELLRFDGPVETSTTRWAREDVELGGQLLQRGDVVRVVLTSANRDEMLVNRPEELDLTRTEINHLAFGYGLHYCLGAPLARLEGEIAFELLLSRLPGLRPAGELSQLAWQSGVIFRGLEQLPVCWDVGKNKDEG